MTASGSSCNFNGNKNIFLDQLVTETGMFGNLRDLPPDRYSNQIQPLLRLEHLHPDDGYCELKDV